MGKLALGIIVGALLVCCLCMGCCLLSFLFLKDDPDFKEGYCAGLREQGISRSEDPFRICR